MRPFCQIDITFSRSATSGGLIASGELANSLRSRRKELGWNQVICAHHLGVCHKTLKNWEAGRTAPEKTFVPTIAKFIRPSAS
jgi:DNA-binding XRE family transcriptional regulator